MEIYNQSKKKKKKSIKCKCNELNRFMCITYNCDTHKSKNGIFNTKEKITPTKFKRELPICWMISSLQFLSSIDWPISFNIFYNKYKNHNLSKYFDFIYKAKSDISNQTFNAAPIANEFIKNFKTGLVTKNINPDIGHETDWDLTEEHDASEFINIFIINIDKKNEKQLAKAFFPIKLDKLQRQMVEFIKNNLLMHLGSDIRCSSCNYQNYKMDGQQSMITLSMGKQKLNGKWSLQELINKYFRTEQITQDYKCPSCNKIGNI